MSLTIKFISEEANVGYGASKKPEGQNSLKRNDRNERSSF